MSDNLTPEAVAKMLEGVTPGPWTVEYKYGTTQLMMGDSCQMCDETYYPWTPDNLKDWHFIAWAREAVPALAARLAEVEAEKRETVMQSLADLGQAQEAYEAQLTAEAEVARLREYYAASEAFAAEKTTGNGTRLVRARAALQPKETDHE
jgi:NADPH-dependent ferric siderophore reductase